MIKKEVIEFTHKNTKFKKDFTTSDYLKYYTAHRNDQIIEKLGYLKEIEFHKQIAQRQNETYNQYRTDPEFLGDQTILIDADYKEIIS